MAEKILYLLGAGASAQALPLVKDLMIGDRMFQGLSKCMLNVADQLTNLSISEEDITYVNEFVENLKWLSKGSERFDTIDTFAKHLFLTDRPLLDRLKRTLSIYFSIEQLYNKKIDNRYLVFLTTILERKVFPANVKILTWNYDFQMELTGEIYSERESASYHNTVTMHRGGFINYYPPSVNLHLSHFNNYNAKDVHLIHLNGIAGLYLRNNHPIGGIFINRNDEDPLTLLKHFNNTTDKVDLLKFDFESVGTTNSSLHIGRAVSFAEKISEETTIMVIIGYSFPFFNRKTDKAIFDKIKESGKLRKIYFQDPYLDGSFLKNQFDLNDVDVIHISRVNSFYIPQEL